MARQSGHGGVGMVRYGMVRPGWVRHGVAVEAGRGGVWLGQAWPSRLGMSG